MKALLLAAVFSLPFSCAHAPKAGDACEAGSAVCQSKGQSLTCHGGKYVGVPCMGPKGCSVTNDRAILCDQSDGATPGTLCYPAYERTGHCAPGGTAVLQCLSGVWTQTACPDGQLCQAGANTVACQ